ncbi:MBL fold metallo-hydrolase [Psychromarinibacter sp. S121]|uniref:MBL fold metallo-hydrolase n=1 Tax=Psychromarinibacter sp. S121 TaxID=3415127 RepID=UPI003C7DA74C
MNRRDLCIAMAASAVLPIFTTRAVANVAVAGGTLTTVSDGNLVLPPAFVLSELTDAEKAEVASRYGFGEGSYEPPCNLTLFRKGDMTVLFDAGSGGEFMPSAGSLLDSLDAAGVSPEDVTHLLFTHAHPDHLWGIIDDFEDLVFANAEYRIGRAEWDYWTRPETVDEIGAERQAFAVGAARRLAILEDRIDFFDDGEEVLPGIAAVATVGHTPGHMSFDIIGDGGGVFVTGDAIANPHISFGWPGWKLGSDQDPETAAATRVALFDRLVAEDRTVAGFHLPGGGIGRVAADGDGYRFDAAE